MEAIGNDDVVKPDVLVEEFLAQSSLKVLPKNKFIDTLVGFVEKGGGHNMEEFVSDSLKKSLLKITELRISDPDATMEMLCEAYRDDAENTFAKQGRRPGGRRMKPRPADYDSDLGPHWGDDDSHWYGPEDAAPAKKKTGRRNRRSVSDEDVEMVDDTGMFVSQADREESVVSQPPKPATKRGAAAKKPPAKKAPATRGRPKKATGFVVDSDEDEEEVVEEEAVSEDAFMDEDEEVDPPAPPPKRATRTTKAATTRAAPSRATKAAPKAKPAAAAAAKTRQSTLNFSQSQRPARGATQTRKALEVSDDEIDDDDDDDEDAFEPVTTTTRSRRR